MGTFLNNVHGLDLKTGTFSADFYLWFRWKGDLSPDAFEIMNGAETTKEKVVYQHAEGLADYLKTIIAERSAAQVHDAPFTLTR
ncbi:MAG: hypothetical protein ACO1SX_20715, partial [Actinomycetota bacterium]